MSEGRHHHFFPDEEELIDATLPKNRVFDPNSGTGLNADDVGDNAATGKSGDSSPGSTSESDFDSGSDLDQDRHFPFRHGSPRGRGHGMRGRGGLCGRGGHWSFGGPWRDLGNLQGPPPPPPHQYGSHYHGHAFNFGGVEPHTGFGLGGRRSLGQQTQAHQHHHHHHRRNQEHGEFSSDDPRTPRMGFSPGHNELFADRRGPPPPFLEFGHNPRHGLFGGPRGGGGHCHFGFGRLRGGSHAAPASMAA
ncbi:hypothetical protein IAR55_003999 [Kwoniella newhampshirensis]|uniref:Cytoplasmic protein n=1 Tax=Kwoniella newhampshirensis TaxID=1651941 RepID=A0AAW0YY15_9TREE